VKLVEKELSAARPQDFNTHERCVSNRSYSQLLELGQSDFKHECRSRASEDDYNRLAESRPVRNSVTKKRRRYADEVLHIHGFATAFKVMAVANHLELDYELQQLDPIKGEHLSAAYAAVNPNKKIPTMEDDGFIL
jgi:hypothetical protein